MGANSPARGAPGGLGGGSARGASSGLDGGSAGDGSGGAGGGGSARGGAGAGIRSGSPRGVRATGCGAGGAGRRRARIDLARAPFVPSSPAGTRASGLRPRLRLCGSGRRCAGGRWAGGRASGRRGASGRTAPGPGAGSSRQPRGPIATSSAAASRAVNRPTFPQRTRLSRAQAPPARLRATPGQGRRRAGFAPAALLSSPGSWLSTT